MTEKIIRDLLVRYYMGNENKEYLLAQLQEFDKTTVNAERMMIVIAAKKNNDQYPL